MNDNKEEENNPKKIYETILSEILANQKKSLNLLRVIIILLLALIIIKLFVIG